MNRSSDAAAEHRVALDLAGATPERREVADALDTFIYDGLLAELAAAHEQIAHLKAVVDSNREIGTAIGIVMALERLTNEQAFERLRRASQDSHLKLRDIAADVVDSGRLPEPSGVGLFHPDVLPLLDLTVWIDIDPGESTRRGLARDAQAGQDDRSIWNDVWAPNDLRFAEVFDPKAHADVVIDAQ